MLKLIAVLHRKKNHQISPSERAVLYVLFTERLKTLERIRYSRSISIKNVNVEKVSTITHSHAESVFECLVTRNVFKTRSVTTNPNSGKAVANATTSELVQVHSRQPTVNILFNTTRSGDVNRDSEKFVTGII